MSEIILDLCGGTGSWSKPYKDASYDVRLVTLPDNDVRNYKPPENVYGILAAPPCTMFSIARTTAKTPRDTKGGMKLVIACLNIIWECQHKGLEFWAMENPVGLLRKFLGRPRFTFQPYEFGDAHTKKTDIWGYFNEPRKKPIKLTDEQLEIIRRGHGNPLPHQQLPLDYNNPETEVAARRAITPSGFAKAFFKSNP